jgi:hypothetical protein
MAIFDRQFEVIMPSLDRLVRKPLEVADTGLIDPTGTSPVPLIDGEFVEINAAYKYARATNTDRPVYAVIEDRGDYGVQASRKLSVLFIGGYEADTVVFDTAVTTLGTALKIGSVNNSLSGSVARAGLVAQGGSGLIVGYVLRPAASNSNKLRFQQVAV